MKGLVSGLKIFVAVVLIITAFLATRIIFKLDNFEQIFTDILGDGPLPKLTQFAFRFSGSIQAISLLIPAFGLVLLFVAKSVKQALAAASISLALTFILSVICNTAASPR